MPLQQSPSSSSSSLSPVKKAVLPAIPPVGRPESYYARQVHHADRANDIHAHEAYKVAQYVTLGLDPTLSWPKKLRYFDHALRRHCRPPPLPSEEVWVFYQELANLVRTHCGEQALFLASAQDDTYADRLKRGVPRETIVADARRFFGNLLTSLDGTKPDHFNEADWAQLKLIRDQWA